MRVAVRRFLVCRWWSEYASRKNDEEEEHVADSLLYDERCHLPRTVRKRYARLTLF